MLEKMIKQKEERVLKNINQSLEYIKEKGFQCSYKKLNKAVLDGKIVKRRGGGFTFAAIDKYIKAFLEKEIDEDISLDKPLYDSSGSQTLKAKSQAEKALVESALAKKKYAEEMGRLCKTETIENELSLRAKAFRLGLEDFAIKNAIPVCEIFGGSLEQARELALRLNISDEERQKSMELIMDFCMDRSKVFTQFFIEKIEIFLDSYSTGKWWTDEMKKTFELYEKHKFERVDDVQERIE